MDGIGCISRVRRPALPSQPSATQRVSGASDSPSHSTTGGLSAAHISYSFQQDPVWVFLLLPRGVSPLVFAFRFHAPEGFCSCLQLQGTTGWTRLCPQVGVKGGAPVPLHLPIPGVLSMLRALGAASHVCETSGVSPHFLFSLSRMRAPPHHLRGDTPPCPLLRVPSSVQTQAGSSRSTWRTMHTGYFTRFLSTPLSQELLRAG